MKDLLVDGAALAALTKGSLEARREAVAAALGANVAQFEAKDAAGVRLIATHQDRAIVATTEGKFFSAAYALDDKGTATFSKVERLEVPLFDPSQLGGEARKSARAAVEAILSGDDEEARTRLRDVSAFAAQGVRLTPEGVEKTLKAALVSEKGWRAEYRKESKTIRAYLGADLATVENVSFEKLAALESIELREGVDAMTDYRPIVKAGFGRIAEQLKGLLEGVARAAGMTGHYRVRGGGENAEIAAVEFVRFARGYQESLKSLLGEVRDAQALAESSALGTLAKLHDEVASQLGEWRIAGTFIGKFSRSLELVRG